MDKAKRNLRAAEIVKHSTWDWKSPKTPTVSQIEISIRAETTFFILKHFNELKENIFIKEQEKPKFWFGLYIFLTSLQTSL